MKFQNVKEKFKSFCTKVGKRNFIIFGALALIIGAIIINTAVLNKAQNESADPNSPAVNQNGDPTDGTNNDDNGKDTYFSSVQISRQRTRDEALEVLQAVVDNEASTETAKNEALAEINKLAGVMANEANIETLIVAKGFEECVAVISGDKASIVVRSDGLNVSQISQINEIVYSEAGIKPINVTIIER